MSNFINRARGYFRVSKAVANVAAGAVAAYRSYPFSSNSSMASGSRRLPAYRARSGWRRAVRARVPRRRAPMYNKPIVVRKTTSVTQDVPDGASVIGGGMNWILSGLPDVSHYTELYEEYRITNIRIAFSFDRHGASLPVAEPGSTFEAGAMYPIYFAKDYNDAAAPTVVEDLLCRNDVTIGQCFAGQRYTFDIKPCVVDGVYSSAGGAINNGGAKRSPWLPCANANIQHYGLKYIMDRMGLTAGDGSHHLGHIFIHTTYTAEFKGFKNV